MSPREQVEFVIDCANRRDFDAIERSGVMHPEMEFHSIVARSEGSVYLGVDGMRDWAVMADGTWEDFHIEVTDVRPGAEQRVLVLLHLTGTARVSGVPLDVTAAQVWHWRDGLLWCNVAYSALEDAARDAGVQ